MNNEYACSYDRIEEEKQKQFTNKRRHQKENCFEKSTYWSKYGICRQDLPLSYHNLTWINQWTRLRYLQYFHSLIRLLLSRLATTSTGSSSTIGGVSCFNLRINSCKYFILAFLAMTDFYRHTNYLGFKVMINFKSLD